MKSDALLALFRTEMRDAIAPYLWDDTEGYAYIDDAQKMFCRLTDGISDASTPEVVDITVAQNATWLDLHPSILKIRAAYRTSDGKPLTIINYEDCEHQGIRFDGRTAPLQNLVVGMEENKLRLDRAASVADAIKLLVFRLPIVAITGDNQDFEIPEQHHMHLLKWVKALALLKQDAETFDKNKSEEMEQQFRAYCALAKLEQAKKRHKVRTVSYGGLPVADSGVMGDYRFYGRRPGY